MERGRGKQKTIQFATQWTGAGCRQLEQAGGATLAHVAPALVSPFAAIKLIYPTMLPKYGRHMDTPCPCISLPA